MKRLLTFFILTVLAVAVAMLMELSWGNLTIWIAPYRVDISLQTALVMLLVFLAASFFIARVLSEIFGIAQRVRRFRKRRAQDNRLRTLSEISLHFFEGRFSRAIKGASELKSQPDLAADVPQAITAALAIGAAAAHEMRDSSVRDQWLSELRTNESSKKQSRDLLIAPLLEAGFALDERHGDRALAALAPLTKGDRRHVHTLRLALRAHQQQSNWDEVLRLTKLLENRKAINQLTAARYKHQAALAWIGEGAHDKARLLIEASLKSSWDAGLCMLYAQCAGEAKEQLSLAERWLADHPDDAEAHFGLGRLCQREQLWGKARQHLEASLRIKPMRDTHVALAQIAQALNEKDTAALHWKAAALFKAST